MSEWTDARIATLRRLWGMGWTASRIATELGGVSRNAVIGKASRIGLAGRQSPIRRDPNAAPANGRARPPKLSKNQRAALVMNNAAAAKRAVEADEKRSGWGGKARPASAASRIARGENRDNAVPVRRYAGGSVSFRTCQFIEGEGRPWTKCGAATVPGSAYCGRHHARCYKRPEEPAAESEAA